MNRKSLFIIITLFLSQMSVYAQNFSKGRVLMRDKITLSNDEGLKVILKRDSNLDDVITINGDGTTIVSSRITYRINSAIYAEDTKAIEVLGTLLNISFMGSNLIIDGREKALVLIDGIESFHGELKKLNANELKEVEIMSNPWAFYGAAAPLAIIKIIKKNI